MFITSHNRLSIPSSLGEIDRFSNPNDPGQKVPYAFHFDNDSGLAVALHIDAGMDKADVTCATAQNYNITNDSNDKLSISIDGEAAVTVDLTAGAARTAAQVVTDINAVFAAASGNTKKAMAYVAGTKVRIVSGTTGSGSSIEFLTIANGAAATLGFTIGKYTNEDAFVLDVVNTITVQPGGVGSFVNARPGARVIRLRGSASSPVQIDCTVVNRHSGVQQ